MARIASNPLSVPRFRPYFQVSDTALLFKSPSLPPYRTPKFQSIICHTNPLPTQTQSSDELNTKWKYSYKTWIDTISDQGTTTVEVLGMVVWLKAAVINEEGTQAIFIRL
ncbi:uncharacterized protein LOC108460530 isoform X2 [Gossypium arboreum]|uniref:Uncharacterized protein n=1 Tax=Gossypium arboreum TaxID=29729 RepID=A0ABR0QII4_GOSAR|nr:uncharacterized protein LOC108460530 isoform X2 [Gossypium arboreum]KAK5839109.1 hypothetical protein PVK06_007871 [Gossypium arboreum]